MNAGLKTFTDLDSYVKSLLRRRESTCVECGKRFGYDPLRESGLRCGNCFAEDDGPYDDDKEQS